MIYLKRLLGIVLLCAVCFGIFQHEKSISQFEKATKARKMRSAIFKSIIKPIKSSLS